MLDLSARSTATHYKIGILRACGFFLCSLKFVARKLYGAAADKHRRGPSTPRYNSSVIRSIREALAQDDDFVGKLQKSGSVCRKHEKTEKVTGAQDDGFAGKSKTAIQGVQAEAISQSDRRPGGGFRVPKDL
jgi:hypothetical protein